MTGNPVPVVLVHGWNSHPGIWNRLVPRLEAAQIPYSRFSHVEMADKNLLHIAGALRDHIRQYQDEAGDDGRYRQTLEGEGVVANRESVLPGISPDIIPPGTDATGRYPCPDLYRLINLPKNPAVIDHIMQYLTAVPR